MILINNNTYKYIIIGICVVLFANPSQGASFFKFTFRTEKQSVLFDLKQNNSMFK